MWNIEELAPEVEAFEQKFKDSTTGQVVFYGSSSIRLWPRLAQAFPNISLQNLGFGGSTLIGCAHYFQRLVVPRQPKAIVLYAGDNDLFLGATPERVWEAYRDLLSQRNEFLGSIPLAFISLKPSPARSELTALVREANEWLRREVESDKSVNWVEIFEPMLDGNGEPRPELYMADQLHLSRAGYEIWAQALRQEAGEIVG